VLSIGFELLAASFFPHVEDPWPERIGLGLPFAWAGVGGVLAGVIHAQSSQPRRDRAMTRGGVWGFRLGASFYSVSLLVQLVFYS